VSPWTLTRLTSARDTTELTYSIPILILELITIAIETLCLIAVLILLTLSTPRWGGGQIAIPILYWITRWILTGGFIWILSATELEDITGDNRPSILKTVQFYTLLTLALVSRPAVLLSPAHIAHTHIGSCITISGEAALRVGETARGTIVVFITYLDNTSTILTQPLSRRI
jgi:hypothetical protein